MSGQTCAWRSLYSAIRSGLTWSWKHTRTSGPRVLQSFFSGSAIDSEVEIADVVCVEPVRLAEQHRVVSVDGELPEVAGGERVTLVALDVTRHERVRGPGREGAKIGRVPERELRHGAVLDVLAHLVRGAEPGQCDLALGVRGGEVA